MFLKTIFTITSQKKKKKKKVGKTTKYIYS